MAIQITRRDLLNGMAIGAVGAMLPAYAGAPKVRLESSMRPEGPSTYYPPTLNGMRGSHAGSFEVAHALAWQGQKPDTYESLDEHYDLVIVGAVCLPDGTFKLGQILVGRFFDGLLVINPFG